MEAIEPRYPNTVVGIRETDNHPPTDILATRKASTLFQDNRQAEDGTGIRKKGVDRRALRREVVVNWERQLGPASRWMGYAYLESHVATLQILDADDELSDFQGHVSFPNNGPELGFRGDDVEVLKAQIEEYAGQALAELFTHWEPLPSWNPCS